MPRELKKTRLVDDVKQRALEEFAAYWPRALATVDQSALHRMGVSMPMMIDVFRAVYSQAFVAGAHAQIHELLRDGVFHDRPFPAETKEPA